MISEEIGLEELKSIINLYSVAQLVKNSRIQECYQRAMGLEVKVDPYVAAINEKGNQFLNNIIACRLKRDYRRVELFSESDFSDLVLTIAHDDDIMRGMGIDDDREEFKRICKVVFKNLLESFNSSTSEVKDLYDEYWRIVEVIHSILDERCILPKEVVDFDEFGDEITRRMFSKEQFIKNCQKNVEGMTDIERIKKVLIQPLIDSSDGIDRLMLKLELMKIIPEMTEKLKKAKPAISEFMDNEVKRIYAE